MYLRNPIYHAVLALALLMAMPGKAGAATDRIENAALAGAGERVSPAISSIIYADPELMPPALKSTGEIIRDCDECPEMVVFSPGHFEMGEPNMKHTVTFAYAFAIGKTEVTQGQWKSIMGYNPSDFQQCGDDCPVEQVSWDEAQEFIRKLIARTGKQYRLPSEAEWEAACRGGLEQAYCGSDFAESVAWYARNSRNSIHTVAGKQANAYGLYDMSGNVWEWVEDSHHANYHGAPVDGRPWAGDRTRRVLRGGAWSVPSQIIGSAVRGWIGPVFRFNDVGFRLARTLP